MLTTTYSSVHPTKIHATNQTDEYMLIVSFVVENPLKSSETKKLMLSSFCFCFSFSFPLSSNQTKTRLSKWSLTNCLIDNVYTIISVSINIDDLKIKVN